MRRLWARVVEGDAPVGLRVSNWEFQTLQLQTLQKGCILGIYFFQSSLCPELFINWKEAMTISQIEFLANSLQTPVSTERLEDNLPSRKIVVQTKYNTRIIKQELHSVVPRRQ